MMGMATLVIRLVMTETLTMVAIVDIQLLQTYLGAMSEWSSRRKEGYSCNVIEIISYVPALQNPRIDISNDVKHGLVGIDLACIRTSIFTWNAAFTGEKDRKILLNHRYSHTSFYLSHVPTPSIHNIKK